MPFLSSNRSLLAQQHLASRPRSRDVFALVANHRGDTRFEIFGALDWPVRHRCSFLSASKKKEPV
jgi:hypothetical protein